MIFSWYTFILALGLAFVEGLEASLLAATRSPKIGWGQTITASLGGIGSAGVIGVIVFYLYYVIPASYIDYSIAVFIFIIGVRELREGLSERASGEEEEDSDKESDSQDQASIMPTYLGVLFETVEVFGYTIAVGHSSVNGYLAPALGGIIGYVIPWFGAVCFREQIEGATESSLF